MSATHLNFRVAMHIEHTTWINNRFVPWSVVVVVVG